MGHNEKRTLANLPPGERILVDSNILTYHLLDYPIFGPICEKFLQDILDKKYHGFITSGCRGREDPSPSGEGMNRAPPLCRKL
jgi:hypothetical protein